jgi:2-dehydro-3-deoxyphosphogluconate aldolase / (4S)-4-hydroxy-2-oxoglutarate aldolase
LEAILDQAVPILPAAATASEAIALMEHGVTEMKFFPAASTGGPQALRALAGPLPDTIFCPTGAYYLALPNVACIGRSWLAPTNLVAAQDWDAITAPAAHVIA